MSQNDIVSTIQNQVDVMANCFPQLASESDFEEFCASHNPSLVEQDSSGDSSSD